ncbi:MAG: flavodoxin family protein [Oscillospiraceae bacterium]|nr:flavodoxin family protein [Oscillospiraceae bacterium]
MRVILVNGSPREKGCTYTALCEAKKVFEENGIEAEIFWVGNKPIIGCIGCGACRKLGKCAFEDTVNEFTELAASADGFIFGTPVHYAAGSGAITSFMDRTFYSGKAKLAGKPAAAVVSCRRGGATATFDQINKYFAINAMPIVSSNYWNQVHGNTPEETLKDEEGIQTVQILAKNMSWLLKCIELGKQNGVPFPEQPAKITTNFIR